MNGLVSGDRLVDGLQVSGIGLEVTSTNRPIDSCNRLVNNPPGPQTHMADLRITHLSLGESYIKARTGHQGVGGVAPESIKVGRIRGANGVVLGCLAVTETIKYGKQCCASGRRHVEYGSNNNVVIVTRRKYESTCQWRVISLSDDAVTRVPKVPVAGPPALRVP